MINAKLLIDIILFVVTFDYKMEQKNNDIKICIKI